MTDASGSVVGDPQNYDPFGNTGDTPGSPIGYSGEWKDASGLIYLRARYYESSTGTFISKDPLSGNLTDPASMNGFNYAADNPINRSDPSGKCYGILSWERDVPGLSTLCTYMDESYAISGCANATYEEKLLANSYITGMIFSQAAFVFGGGYLAGEAPLAGLVQYLPPGALL